MAIELRHMAKVNIPDEMLRAMVLGMYSYESRYGNTFFNYHYQRGGPIFLPPNYVKLETVANMLGEDIVDQRTPGPHLVSPFQINPNFGLRPYQLKPTADLIAHVTQKKMGTLHAGCGCGKTVVLTRAAGQLGRKTLVLIDQGNLKTNWIDAFDFIWGRKLQNLTATTGALGDCVISTFQLLARNATVLDRVRNEFGTLLADECHVVKAPSYKEVMSRMNNQYRISCTATFNCKSFDNGILEDWTSPICVKMVDDAALFPHVRWHRTGVPFCSEDPMDFGSKILPKLAGDQTRNAAIFGVIRDCLARKRRTVIICIKEDQAILLAGIIRNLGGRAVVYTGSTSTKKDQEVKDQMNRGDLDFILTCKKMDKGTDIDTLDTIIMAKPNNNKNDTEQQSGRIRRKVEGKPLQEVHDFIDEGYLAYTFAKNRNRWYENVDGKGYIITNPELLDEIKDELRKKGLDKF